MNNSILETALVVICPSSIKFKSLTVALVSELTAANEKPNPTYVWKWTSHTLRKRGGEQGGKKTSKINIYLITTYFVYMYSNALLVIKIILEPQILLQASSSFDHDISCLQVLKCTIDIKIILEPRILLQASSSCSYIHCKLGLWL